MTTAMLERGHASGRMLSNWWPPRDEWPEGEIGQALDRVVRTHDEWSRAGAELRRLLSDMGRVQGQDARARGRAMADGKKPPTAEAPKVQARIVELERLVPAAGIAYEIASNEALTLIAERGRSWFDGTVAARDDALRQYADAVEQARAARRALADRAAIVGWHERRMAGRLRNVAPVGEGSTFVSVAADLAQWSAPPRSRRITVEGDDS